MTKFFFKLKNPIYGHFRPISRIFWANTFSTKLSCYAQLLKVFWHHAQIQRNLMIQFQENTQTNVRRQRWTDLIS